MQEVRRYCRTPGWLFERVDDPFGTPNNHPFWETVEAERVGGWKLFERDGWWYVYGMNWNDWFRFSTREKAFVHATSVGGKIDPWI